MKGKFGFAFAEKLRFYFGYFKSLVLIPFDCREGVIPVLSAEIIWKLNSIFGIKMTSPFQAFYIRTKDGNFFLDPDLTNTIIVSPVFERQDKDYLLSLISKALKERKKVLFIDVGAHFGIYTVLIGRTFRKYKNLKIYSFEPDSEMFSMNSYKLLKRNIRENNIKRVKVFHFGLGSDNLKRPNKIKVITRRLDSVLKPGQIRRFDLIVMKIDIEGYEKSALKGAAKVINSCKDMTVLIEDCVNKKIVDYMKEEFIFHKKLTPYNSFWIKK